MTKATTARHPAGLNVTFVRGNKRRWRTSDAVIWHIGRAQSGRVIIIPPGREFESSVPRWARLILSPDDPRFLLAALIHDVMLEDGIYGPTQAAAEWHDAALAGGAPRRLAALAYIAVAAWAVVMKGEDKQRVMPKKILSNDLWDG